MNALTRFRLGALLVLGVGLSATTLFWPLPSLGFDPNPGTGVVVAVQPDSPAARAGVQPGDQVLRIYDYAWQETNTRLWLVPLPWSTDAPTPMTVWRDGASIELTLWAGPPDRWLQVEKVLRGLIALTCWLTGYLLGRSPRARDWRVQTAAWFWIALGGTLGVYQLSHVTSYLLTIGVLWAQCTLLAPLAVAMHAWYPPRPTTPAELRHAWRWLVAALVLAQAAFLGLVLSAPVPAAVFTRLDAAATYIYLISVIVSALVLTRVYRATVLGHIRRQIRLIGIACLLVGCWWALLILAGWGHATVQALVPPVALPFGAILIPLAYLVSGTRADLMRIDQIARWLLVQALTIVGILSVLVVGMRSGLLVVTPALALLVAITLYPLLVRLVRRRVAPATEDRRAYQALRAVGKQLGTSLATPQLLAYLHEGVERAFLRPPLAIYHRRDPEAEVLLRVVDDQLRVPATVATTLLAPWQQQGTRLLRADALQAMLGQQPLDAATAELVFHPGVVLWGIMRHQQGKLLGLILIGPRGDDDPYEADDLRELEQLVATAALALSNSASYDLQVLAQAMLRALYRHARHVEERTATGIANEIHDEVINVHLGSNIELLAQLIETIPDPALQQQLRTVLANEEAMRELLRLTCEQLKPVAIEDAYGLHASLRQQTFRAAARARIPVHLEVVHQPVRLDERLRRALVRIVREALTNAIKHASPTEIWVTLRLPAEEQEPLVLTVQNDGLTPPRPISATPGHWGVRNMREYADAVGATIAWSVPATGGTLVTVVVPAAVVINGVPPEVPWSTLPSWTEGPERTITPDTTRAGAV